jgi:hypothetical protein
MSSPGRSRVRDAFVRVLGVIFVIAFWSLGRQVVMLYGAHGLLPACPVAAGVVTSVFRAACSDRLLWWGTVLGGGLGVLLALGVLPRWTLIGCWALYSTTCESGPTPFWPSTSENWRGRGRVFWSGQRL